MRTYLVSPFSFVVLTAAAGLALAVAFPRPAAAQLRAGSSAASTSAATAAVGSTDAPDAAVRTFFVAMAERDDRTLRGVIVPVSDADFRYLMSFYRGTPQGYIPRIVKAFSTMPIEALHVGSVVSNRPGSTTTVPAGAVGPKRALLLPAGIRTPVPVVRVNNQWRIDPGPLIADRRATDSAEAARMAAARRIPPHAHSAAFGKVGLGH